jgi:hypothetical protein
VFTIVGFVIGLAGGAAGTAAWLLSEPAAGTPAPDSLSGRLDLVKARLEEALAEGRHAGAETENRLRHELDSYRRHPDRPGTSSVR